MLAPSLPGSIFGRMIGLEGRRVAIAAAVACGERTSPHNRPPTNEIPELMLFAMLTESNRKSSYPTSGRHDRLHRTATMRK